MKTNDTIKVHLYDLHNKEIQTRNYGKVFRVYEKAGKLGIDWNTEESYHTVATVKYLHHLKHSPHL